MPIDIIKDMGHRRMVLLSGPTAVGKETVQKEVLKRVPNLVPCVSYTTRPMGRGDIHGFHYFFIEKELFQEKIAQGFFLEHEEVHGDYYGTPRKDIEDSLSSGLLVLHELDCKGANTLRSIVPGILSIFLLPPSREELDRRIRGRGRDSVESIQKRLDRVSWEMTQADSFDYQVVNDDLETAVEEVVSIIMKHLVT